MIFSNSWASRQHARCALPMGAVLRFGGESSSTQSNKTENKDMRIAGGNASTNVSADNGSAVTVVSTDHGAVSGGLQLASQAVDASVKQSQGVQDTTLSLFSGALGAVKSSYSQALGAVQDSYSQSASNLATAYADSKTPDMAMMKVGAVVVVGLAAVMLLAKAK